MHHRPLHCAPYFEALSYEWGPQEDKVCLQVGKDELKITPNLRNALHRLRDRIISRWLWIDQVCINQEDDVEKAAEIGVMKEIYENASRVVIWLGGGDETSEKAMSFMEEWASTINMAFNNFDKTVAITERNGKPVRIRGTDLVNTFFNRPEYQHLQLDMEAVVQAVMTNTYFERFWIIQEVVLARDAVVQYGAKSFPWSTVNRFIKGILSFCPSLVDTARVLKGGDDANHPIAYLCVRLHELQEQIEQDGRQLLHPWWIIHAFRYSKATIPSDRVYAWLALYDKWKATGFQIDYKRDHHETFTLFTRAMIEHDHSLSWLSHAGSPRNDDRLSASIPHIDAPSWVPVPVRPRPSWVPDLELPVGIKPDPLVLETGLFSADKGSDFHARFSADSFSIFCRGVCVDKIVFMTADTLEKIACCLGALHGTIVPREASGAATSRYGDSLKAELQQLFTANRGLGSGRRGICRVSKGLTSFVELYFAGARDHIESRLRPWFNAMGLLPESTLGRRADFLSEKGFVGLVPEYATEGDLICVLFGSEVPVVLRKEGGAYKFIGDCYVARMMDGEYAQLVKQGEAPIQEFELR